MAEELLGTSFAAEKALNGTAAFKTLLRTRPQPRVVNTELLFRGSSSLLGAVGRRGELFPSPSPQDLWQ